MSCSSPMSKATSWPGSVPMSRPSARIGDMTDDIVPVADGVPDTTSSVMPAGTVTLLFTDIEGSTRLLDRLRGEYAQVLEDQRRLLRSLFERWHGHEVDTQGDSYFAAFPSAQQA